MKYVLLILFISCSHQSKKVLPPEIDLFCRDLSVAIQKIDIISQNLANKDTTRTVHGGYYKTQIVVNCNEGICQTKNDESPPILKYLPKHPDANEKGYVAYNNMNVTEQVALLIHIQRAYEFVIASAPVKKDFFLRDPRAELCFAKYPAVEKSVNYKRILER